MTDPKKPDEQKDKDPKNENNQQQPLNKGKGRRPQPLKPNANDNKNGNNPDPKKVAAAAGAVGLAAIAALYFANKNMQGPGNSPAGKTPPKSNGGLFDKAKKAVTGKETAEKGKVTFDDVAGIDEIKAEMMEIVALMKGNIDGDTPDLGQEVPKGALLYGPPGCGKTLIGRAIAGEAGMNFVHASGSDFVEMYVGVGARRVRDLFKEARSKAPCVLFIDEIDGVARHRSQGSGSSGAREHDQTLNALLVEMDGMNGRDGVFVIGATNRKDMLDPAVIRPGRLDVHANVPLPDITGREEILNVHIRNKKVADDFDAKQIARGTPGFSGADMENIAKQAALIAARQKKSAIETADFEAAKDKIMMGAARKLVMDEEEIASTAYHEAGHAVAILAEAYANPIIKGTIVPHGPALGAVFHAPERDQYSHSKASLKAQLVVAAAGRAAEELFFQNEDDITGGAMGDIQQMDRIANLMVRKAGLSSLGMRDLSTEVDPRTGARKAFSAAVEAEIEKEVNQLIDDAYKTAKSHLEKNYDAFKAIAEALIERETLSGEEIKQIAEENGMKVAERYNANKPTRKLGLK